MDTVSSIDTYVDLLLSIKNVSPITLLSAFFLSLARLLPIMVFAPFFGARLLPAPIRVMFSVAILTIIMPQILFSLKGEILFNFAYTGLFLKEILVGFILGLLITIPFYIAQSSGSLIDFMRGSSSFMVTDLSSIRLVTT